MNCEQVRTSIKSLPKAEWSSVERELIEQHASSCAQCRSALELETHLESALRSLTGPELSSSMADGVMAQIEARQVSHAKAPSKLAEVLSDIAKSVGIALGLGAHLFRLIKDGAMSEPARFDQVWQALTGTAFSDPIVVTFLVGAILFLVGLFAPLGSVDARPLDKPH